MVACDRKDKYEGLTEEFAANVWVLLDPLYLNRGTHAETLSRIMYKFSKTAISFPDQAIISSTASKLPRWAMS